jgi:predicted XRE-type DNA-binding protein
MARFGRLAPGHAARAAEVGNTVNRSKNIGTDFTEFLEEEGLLEEAQTVAIKRVIAWQLGQLMQQQALTKVELARCMNTSRAALTPCRSTCPVYV